MPCLCIIGILACKFNKPKQFSNDSIESHSGDASVSWLKRDKQRLWNIGTWASISRQNSTHLSVNWCISYQFPIDFDCWFVSVEAKIGQLLIVKWLLHCQAWLKFWRFPMSILHQRQRKSKLSQVNWYANTSTKHHDLFKQQQFPVFCQIHLLVGFWGSMICSSDYCLCQSCVNLFLRQIQVNCQVIFWCIAFWGSLNCSNNFIYWTPLPCLQVNCYLWLDKNIPYLSRRLHNILWGRMVANNNKDERWFYLPFQHYWHEGLWPQQAHQAHQ